MTMQRLRRYSKPRGAGDQTSGGRGKLLRPATGLSRVELAVRETLQNSWDARSGPVPPLYRIHVYALPDESRATLRDRIFTDLPQSLSNLAKSLAAQNLHVVEFVDRGTTGLDGPFRASEVAAEGERNNFNSFVFDIGTTKSSARAGGTFGFGKTAAFEVSGAHSVVYWTRCRAADGSLEHRLIATTLHDPYEERGARFTGAHWWGDARDSEIVPLRGEQAEALGQAVFRTHFASGETGTSILVIDPVMLMSAEADPSDAEATPLKRVPVRTDEHRRQLTAQIADGLAASGWPKMVRTGSGQTPMDIQLFDDDLDLNIAASVQSQYSTYADVLTQVRQFQAATPITAATRPPNLLREKTFPIRLRPHAPTPASRREFFGDRTDQIVGHLHIAVSIRASGSPTGAAPANRLCLMRSEAELVVRYEPLLDVSDDVLQWHGVFKPTPDCDRHFSASEPPTHDSWNASSAESEISSYVVEKSLQQIRRKAINYLSEYKPPVQGGTHSVRSVATGLRSFVPLGTVDAGEIESPRRHTYGSSKRAKRESGRVEVIATGTLADGMGQRLTIRLHPANGPLRVSATAHAITSEGRLPLASDELEVTWTETRSISDDGLEAHLAPGETAVLELRTRMQTALDVELQTEALT